ncbi:DUF2946 domain-containing protein [Massilia horti]|uniref:DUF2946 domain-containing protein n=1 Tax=Massilia horti TaxID=2562153 RepID=A0A4Y9T831_9BURK|nr:DUF2946 domain-containing protein [Massilia horti]
MGLRSRRHILSAWLACFAILAASLMPTVSRALAAAGDAAFAAEICSASGTRVESPILASHHDSGPDQHGLQLDHCGYCLTHAGSFGLLPIFATIVPALPDAPAGAQLLPQTFHPIQGWTIPQSRAPPSAA